MIYVCEDETDFNRVMWEIRRGDKLYVPLALTTLPNHEKRISDKRYNVASVFGGGAGMLVEKNGTSWIKYRF